MQEMSRLAEQRKIEACKFVSQLMVEKAIQEGSLSGLMLAEAFTASEFDKLVNELVKFAKFLPPQMKNTISAVKKAGLAARNTYKNFRLGKVDRQRFAAMTSRIVGLMNAIGNALEDMRVLAKLKAGLRSLTSEGLLSEAKTLRDILDKEDLKTLQATVGSAFVSDGLLARLFGQKKSWFGLTAEQLVEDLLSIDLEGLKKLVNEVPEELESALTAEDEEAIVAQASGNSSEEEDEEYEEEEEKGEPSSKNVITGTIKRDEIEVALRDVFGETVPMGIVNRVLNVLQDKGLQVEHQVSLEDEIMLERWRRLSGIKEIL